MEARGLAEHLILPAQDSGKRFGHGIRPALWFAIIVLALTVLRPAIAIAQDTSPAAAAERQIIALNAELEGVAKDLQLPEHTAQTLAEKRAAIEQIRAKARQAAAALKAPIADLDTRLEQLGPAPVADTPETAAIASQRQTLGGAVERFNAAERQLTLIAVEAEQLSARVSGMQRDRFVQQIFESSRSILNPLLWWEGARSVALLAERLMTLLGVWYAEVTTRLSPALLAAAAAAIAALPVLSVAIYRPLARRYEPVLRARSPSNFDRLWRVTRTVILMSLVLLLLLFGAAGVVLGFGVSTPRLEALFSIGFDFVATFFLATAFARTIFSPRLPAWRLPRLDDATARQLDRLAIAAALLLAIDASTAPIVELLFLPIAFPVGQSAVLTLLMLLVVLGALQALRTGEQQPATAADDPAKGRRSYFDWLAHGTQVAWFVIALASVALLLGYVALAHFVVFNAVQTLVYVSVLYILRLLIDELIAAATQRTSAVGVFLRQAMSLPDRAVARLGVTLGVVVDLLIAVIGIPVILLLWTDTWIDIGSWLARGYFGFEVAGVAIEPANLFTALAILLVGLGATKIITRWLDKRVLARTQLDKGVRDSVKKSIGYTGVLLAGVFALTSAGVGFSNIALIAGALGVGIGFGLQSIVNNFVSGLILLAERPVKVGDWIVVGAGEGFVKQINVRSTEIETFDNCTIIVPNSSLIAEPVKNWTHHDTIGKITVPVSVARDSEPGKVRAILLDCAKAHKGVMRDPEPAVLLNRFADSSLDFALQFHVEDILWGAYVASDIRFAILAAFREAKVVMPYPQREVLMRHP